MSESSAKKKILMIGWDAADWKFITPLLDTGLMPHLSKLVDGGVMANLASLQPCLSPILWTSIATGKTADKHGIAGFVEPIPGGGGVRLSSSTSRKTKAIWNMLSQSGFQTTVINWYASYPAEPVEGTCISNRFFEGLPDDPSQAWKVLPGSVHPASLASDLDCFRMHPAELTPHDLKRFIPGIEAIDLSRDPRPSILAQVLAKTISIHSVATGAMEAEPWDFLAVYYDGLDTIGHQFMPFHPPQLPNVSDTDFAIYASVMRELYLFHDEMLGRLLELAGPDTTVILLSDHGFHCDHLRPVHFGNAHSPEADAAQWHRHYGILVMKGPDILQDERIYGANLLDITPTILALLGLPAGKDMDGVALMQAFSNPPKELTKISSWDKIPGKDGMHPAEKQQAMMESPEVVAQLVALGYLPAETAESTHATAIAIAESQFNLATVHSSHSRPFAAQELLEELHRQYPQIPRYALALAHVYAKQKLHDRSLAMIQLLEANGARSLDADLLSVAELFNVGQIQKALLKLQAIEVQYPMSPSILRVIGTIHLSRSAWLEAYDTLGKCVELEADDPTALNGLARAAVHLGHFEEAAECALRAIGLLYFFPQAHFHMGIALQGLGDNERAMRSLKIAVAQAPSFLEAHRVLSGLCEQANDLLGFLKHQRIADGLPTL
jgi:tetratricopeptide (TPR) repeat protein